MRRFMIRGDAHGHDGTRMHVVFDADTSMGERKVFFNQRQSASNASNISFHGRCCRRKTGKLGFLLFFDAWALICKPDRVPSIENRNDDFLELGVDEILAYFADDGIRNGSPCLLSLGIYSARKIFDVFVRAAWADLGHARRAAEIIVRRDASGGYGLCVIARHTIFKGIFHLICHSQRNFSRCSGSFPSLFRADGTWNPLFPTVESFYRLLWWILSINPPFVEKLFSHDTVFSKLSTFYSVIVYNLEHTIGRDMECLVDKYVSGRDSERSIVSVEEIGRIFPYHEAV